MACITVENVKILIELANGEISMSKALNKMGNTIVAMDYGLCWSDPVIGGIAGGMLGYAAGLKSGQLVFKGVKTVAEGAVNIVKTRFNKIKEAGSKIYNLIFG